MKLAVAADIHARGKDLPEFTRQLRAAFTEASRRGVNHFFFAGDVFDTINIASGTRSVGEIVKAVKDVVLDYSATTCYFLPGQHDKKNGTSTDALEVLAGIPNVYLIRIPFRVQLTDGDNSVAICCIPWHYEDSSYPEINKIAIGSEYADRRILCAHLQVRGARQNGGHVCETGSFSVSKSQLESFGFDRLWLGDFHARQEIIEGTGGYVGALRQLNFGHCGEPQGFEVYDTETNTAEWIELSESPRYEVLEWHEGTPQPEATPGHMTRIKAVGWTPGAKDYRETDSSVTHTVKTTHTKARINIDTENIDTSDRHALLDLHLDSTKYSKDRKPLHSLLDTLEQ